MYIPTISCRQILERIFLRADVRINDGRAWDICVRDPRFYQKTFFGGSLGFGEAYMEGWWSCEDIEEMVCRLLRSNIERVSTKVPSALRVGISALAANNQTRRKAMDVADCHYNLDPELFRFLGKYMNYSSGYFGATDDLDTAQEHKLELICRKLNLARGERLLDIGGGWGEFARYAAERYGCHVTSINIADKQLAFAREYCKGRSVNVVKCDYRDLSGTYDKAAAIAMVAHVGRKNYRTFMEIVHRHLTADGILLIETVGNNLSMTHCDPWVDRYIFPHGMTPALSQLAFAMEDLFVIEDVHNFGPHYIKTLRAWRHNFEANWPRIAGRYDERFRRMFNYFFQICAGAFKARSIQYWHLVVTKTGAAQPPFRRLA
jgi:cyclopropane-fatty-acyl-phospholipid synthase